MRRILCLLVLLTGFCPVRAQADTTLYASVYNNTEATGEILKFTNDGTATTVTTFASGFTQPEGIVFDNSHNLYVLDGSIIYKIDPLGNKSIFVTDSSLWGQPGSGLAMDASGNLYAPAATPSFVNIINEYDSSGHLVKSISSPGGLISGMAFDSSGNLIGAETFNGTLGSFDSAGNRTPVLAPDTTITFPNGVAFDPAGNLYVSDGDKSVYKINPDGTAGVYLTVDAPCSCVMTGGLVFDLSGNLYLANQDTDGTHNSITVTTSSGTTTTFASLSDTRFPNYLAFDPVATPEPGAWELILAGLVLGAMYQGWKRYRTI